MGRQDKRALVDEAVQDTLPIEKPDVGSRQATNLYSVAAAEGLRPGFYTNPEIFNELMKISVDAHTTRRESRNQDFRIAQSDFDRYMTDLTKSQELQSQLDQTTAVLDQYNAREANFADEIEQAERTGRRKTEVLQDFLSRDQQQLDRYAEESPFMYQKYRDMVYSDYARRLPGYVAYDYNLAETKMVNQVDNMKNLALTRLMKDNFEPHELGPVAGVSIAERVIGQLIAVGSNISEQTEFEKASSIHNEIALADAARMAMRVQNGQATVEEAKEYILGSLLSSMESKIYTGQRDTTRVDADVFGETEEKIDKKLEVTLTPQTISKIVEIANNLDPAAAKLNAVHAKEEYFELVGKGLMDQGKLSEIQWYTYATPEEAANLLQRTLAPLNEAIRNGDQKAIEMSVEIARYHYSTVVPTVNALTMYRKMVKELGSEHLARQYLMSQVSAINNAVRNPGMMNTSIPELIYQFSDGSIANINVPSDALAQHGVDTESMHRNYYATMGKTLQSVLDTPNLTAQMDPTYQNAQSNLNNRISASNIITTDPKTGEVRIRDKEYGEALAALKETRRAELAASSDKMAGLNNSKTLEKAGQDYSKLNTREQQTYALALARMTIDSGIQDMFYAYNTQNLTDDARLVAKDVAIYSMLLKAGSGYTGVLEDVKANRSDVNGQYSKPTEQTVNNLLKGKFHGSPAKALDFINKLITDYNISGHEADNVRNTLINVAVAEMVKHPDQKVEGRVLENIVNANYTKQGTYKGMSIYNSAAGGSLSLEAAEGTMNKANKLIKDTGTTGKEGLEVRINQYNGNLTLHKNGNPYKGYGNGYIAGSTEVPLEISMKKDTAWSTQEQFDRHIASTAQLAVELGAIATIGNPSRVAAYIKRSGKATDEQMRSDAHQLLAVMSDVNNQEIVNRWAANNYSKVTFTDKAPAYLVDAFYQGMITETNNIGVANRKTSYQDVRNLADAYWSLRKNGKAVSSIFPENDVAQANGSLPMGYSAPASTPGGAPVYNIPMMVQETGVFTITSGLRPNDTGSLHSKGMAFDIGVAGGFNKCLDPTTGVPRIDHMDKLLKKLEPAIKSGQITSIGTGFSEFVNGRSNAKTYQKYRDMKNAKGESLFKELSGHRDHFHISTLGTVSIDTKTGRPVGMTLEAFAEKCAQLIPNNINSANSGRRVTPPDCKGLAYAFPNYTANEWDAKNMGKTMDIFKGNAYAHKLALCTKYADLQRALGGDKKNMAIIALAGGKLDYLPDETTLSPIRGVTAERAIELSKKSLPAGRWVLNNINDQFKYANIINTFIRGAK